MSFNSFGAKIKVVGVGGGGGNAVNTMIRSGLEGVDFIVANTDAQALKASLAPHKIQLGKELTKGLGAGADPDIGRDAALEDRMELQDYLSDADMVFITAGMGGGTGTGAAAVVAQIARELGALTVAVVTKPFAFEGKRRRKHGDIGVARLRECVDTLITIPNQRLLQVATPDLSMLDAFKLADNVLVNAVRGISDIINTPGLINVDFADVKTVMSSMGHALMGIGYGVGADRALGAARQAISSPLLEDVDIEGATGILINITAGTNVSIMEVNNACMVIQEAAHEDANIIFGAVIDEALGDEIRITVIATGFPVEESLQPEDLLQSASNRSNHLLKSQPAPITQRLVAPPRLTTPIINAQRERAQVAQPPHIEPPNMPNHERASRTVATTTANVAPPVSVQPVAEHASPSRMETSATPTTLPTNNPRNFDHRPAHNPMEQVPILRDVKSTSNHMHVHDQSPLTSQSSSADTSRHDVSRPDEVFDLTDSPQFAEVTSDESNGFVNSDTSSDDTGRYTSDWDIAFDMSISSDSITRNSNIDHSEYTPLGSSESEENLSNQSERDSASAPVIANHTFDESPSPGKTVAEMVFSTDHESDHRAGATRDVEESPWDFDPQNPLLVSDEIDRRIDEALSLAGQLKGIDSNPRTESLDATAGLDLDDLELPAFLRNNTDSNPL
jgi:cell division protein FtsZ